MRCSTLEREEREIPTTGNSLGGKEELHQGQNSFCEKKIGRVIASSFCQGGWISTLKWAIDHVRIFFRLQYLVYASCIAPILQK